MVPNCTNGWRKTRGTNISYHRLPTNHMKKLWLQQIRRDNPRDAKHSFVCSEHFSPDCYVIPLSERLCGQTKRKQLKPDAVPTIFKHTENAPKTQTRTLSERRRRTQERNEVQFKYN